MKIGIIGFGRFGQLFARHLKTKAEVLVSNRSDKRAEAEKLGVRWAEDGEIFKVDLLILCVPISETKKVLENIKNKILPRTIVIDTCSVKVFPCRWLKNTLKENVEIAGTHPMFGPDSAKNGFQGKQIVLCPLRISRKNLDKLTRLFKSFNLKIVLMTPQEHDRQAAKCLSLVHFIGRGISGIGLNKQEISTLGYERLLKVKETVENDTWQLFEDLNNYNPYAGEVRSQFIKKLEKINNQLISKEIPDELPIQPESVGP